MSYLNPETWRKFTRAELAARFADEGLGRRRQRSNLVLQESVSPFDAYTYLHARFGEPNGMQTTLARDDSDNLYHWDYYLKAGDRDLAFIGATEEIHVWFDGAFGDGRCVEFIAALRRDFGRIGQEKGRFASRLERWTVFPNQYLSIATRCADLYDQIDRALTRVDRTLLRDKAATEALVGSAAARSHSRLMVGITSAPTELSVLMPVMFESFVGLIVAVLIRPEVKHDAAAFAAFVRSPLNQKLVHLADRCAGFQRPLRQNDPVFGRYWTVVNKRNDVIHGNVDPVRDVLEVVYFDGKRPLFPKGGDRMRRHWLRLIDRYRPGEILEDYVAMNMFILDILDHMTDRGRAAIEMVMEDMQPGWDNRRRIPGRLFPEHVATAVMPGMRYDWQLPRRG